MSIRKAEAWWDSNRNRWRINAQKNGIRKTFYSSVHGQRGKREAERKANNWKLGLLDNLREHDPLVSILWESYLSYLKLEKNVGTSTIDQTKKFGRNYILPICGQLQISKLNEGHLQRVLNLAAQKGCLQEHPTRPPKGPLSIKTLRGIRNTEQQFVKWCRINDYTDLILEGLEIHTHVEKTEKEILQPDDLKILFTIDTRLVRGKRVFDEQIYSYRFAVVTGLRPGELLGLRIGDIEGAKLYVRRAINRYGENTKGKNQNARREFGLNSFAKAILQQQLELLCSNGMSLETDQPLFPALNQQSRYNQWKSYAKSNNIAAISCYEMRHTFISLAQNLPEGDLRRLCGQSQNMDTRGVYAHKLNDDDQRIASELDLILGHYLNLQDECNSGVPQRGPNKKAL